MPISLSYREKYVKIFKFFLFYFNPAEVSAQTCERDENELIKTLSF